MLENGGEQFQDPGDVQEPEVGVALPTNSLTS